MTISRMYESVFWSGSRSKAVLTGNTATSDLIFINAGVVNAQITLKADVTGAGTSTDKIYFWLLESSGGVAADEFSTIKHAHLLGIVSTDNEDPAILTVPFPLPQKWAKLYADGETAGTSNVITVSARITGQRIN